MRVVASLFLAALPSTEFISSLPATTERTGSAWDEDISAVAQDWTRVSEVAVQNTNH